MNKYQENKYSMYLTVQTYLNERQSEWETLPILVSQKSEFDNFLEEIKEARRIQETDITGITRDKETKADHLGDKVVELAAGLQSFALINGDSQLQEEVFTTPARFDLLNDTGKITFSEMVHEKTAEHLADLADFNTTQEDIDELKARLEAYEAVVQKPREAISEAAAATDRLARKMNEAYKTLIIIDNLVQTFQAAKPDFVQGYKNARVIVD